MESINFREFVQNHETKRGHFFDYWRSLRETEPVIMQPISKFHRGPTRGEDVIRVSGSPRFIATIMARLKELLTLDNEHTKLDVAFHPSKYTKENGERSYILYIKAQNRFS